MDSKFQVCHKSHDQSHGNEHISVMVLEHYVSRRLNA